jgi:hypothetical protein
MATSRKKAILDQVEKQRRRNRIITVTAIVLIAVIVVAVVIALPKSGSAVPLPGYLDRCVTATLLYHSHPGVSIVINGSSFTIPANVGINGNCLRPVHTHDTSGTIHIETDENRDYTLGDFFLIWGNWENNAQRTIFNSTQIFGGHVVNGNTLTMTINGVQSTMFQNYVLPRDACDSSSTCTGATTNQINIVITYTLA